MKNLVPLKDQDSRMILWKYIQNLIGQALPN